MARDDGPFKLFPRSRSLEPLGKPSIVDSPVTNEEIKILLGILILSCRLLLSRHTLLLLLIAFPDSVAGKRAGHMSRNYLEKWTLTRANLNHIHITIMIPA